MLVIKIWLLSKQACSVNISPKTDIVVTLTITSRTTVTIPVFKFIRHPEYPIIILVVVPQRSQVVNNFLPF